VQVAQSWLASPYHLLIRTSLALAVGVGFSLGLYLVLGFAFGLPLAATSPALVEVHGQVQVFGFVGLFIMAVAVQLVPRFHASRMAHPTQVSVGGLLLAAGLILRLVGQPLLPGVPLRATLLVLSGIFELVGVLLAVHTFALLIGRGVTPPRGWEALLPATLGGSLVLALVLNLVACLELAQGALVVPYALDEALLHLEVWGFASTMVLAISGRVFPKFLLLQPTRAHLARAALGLWAVGSFGVPLVWLVFEGTPALRFMAALAQFGGAVLFVTALRLYDPAARESGTPHITNPTRRWVRLAYALMLTAAAANLGIAAADFLGRTSTVAELSGARHLVAQGFLLPMIQLMAARILPGYSGHMLKRGRLLGALLWSLLAGAALRGGAELAGGYAPGWSAAVALGGTLTAGAFVVFAVGLWRSTNPPLRA